jgi:hypothetical protein
MRLLQFYAPRNWPANNAQDLDMSTAPAVLSDGQVVAAAKSGTVYLLNSARLGGIGRQEAALGSACSIDIDGGFALAGTTVYLPCLTGVIAVRATRSPASLRLLWSAGNGGGPPIIAAGLVWTIIVPNGILVGLNPANGRVRQQAAIGAEANHFPTPSVGDGLLLAPSARRIVAFRAASSRAASPLTPVTAPTSPASQPAPAGGGISPGAIAGSVLGGLVAVGGAGWLLWRRQKAGQGRVQLVERSASRASG